MTMHDTHPRLIVTLAALAALAACSSPPVAAPKAPPSVAAQAPAPAARPATPPAAAAAPRPAAAALAPHLDPNSLLSRERVVFFAFDSDVIDADGRAVVERHARHLVSNPTLVIKVEGHADERGGSEYNLALGQRRAEAVRRALALLGVADARVEATSWGEERPMAVGHDEAAWERNRRGEIVYPPR
jgi:peptidoglycan-associated lipoprotein